MSEKYLWTKMDPTPDPTHGVPCERSSHGVSLLKNGALLIIYGGEHVARTPLDSSQATWAVEKKDDKWSYRLISSVTTPDLRVAHAQTVYNDSVVYIFGGRSSIKMDEAAMNDMWKLDLGAAKSGTEKWEEVQPDLENGDEPPEARSFHKMLCVGCMIYVFGGCGAAGRLADLHCYNILKNTWKKLPVSSLRGRGGPNFMTFSSSKLIGVIAGFCGEESNDGQIFDLATEKWNDKDLKKELFGLRPRSVCISASFPSCKSSIIFGGEVDPSERGHEGAGCFENDLVILNEETGEYLSSNQASDVCPEKRGWSDGAAIDLGDGKGLLYIFGGLVGDDVNPKRLNDLWCLEIQKQQ